MAEVVTQEQLGNFTVRQFLETSGASVARFLADGAPIDQSIKVTTLRSGRTCRVMRMEVAGRTAVIKHFNRDVAATKPAYEREYNLSRYLEGTGLTPRLLASDADMRFLVTEFVPGPTLEEELNEQNVLDLARELGQWYVGFSAKMPVTTDDTNWYDYLSRYDDVLTEKERLTHRSFLEGLPIREMRIAKNDAHTSNFIRMENGGLLGLDFETALVKPFGWDLLVTARVLVMEYPGLINDIVQAIMEGWGRGTDAIAPEAFHKLLTIFVLATSFKAMTENRLRLERSLKAYNAHRPKSAARVKTGFLTPYMPNKLASQDRGELASFRAFLDQRAHEALSTPPEPIPQIVREKSEDPHPAMQAACATCLGFCCHNGGADNRAYLTTKTLKQMQSLDHEVTAEAIVAAYMSYVPEAHVEGSCYYHGPQGCTLPREMRSNTCNNFLCQSLRLFWGKVDQVPSCDSDILIVASKDGEIMRASVLTGETHGEVDIAPLVEAQKTS